MAGPGFGNCYDGPITESEVVVAGRRIKLVRPTDPDRLLDAPEVIAWNAADDYMPYWAYLWPGAFLLGEVLAQGDWVPGTKVLELGCGLGLTGLFAVSMGLHVHFTDQDPTALQFLEASAQANGFAPSTYSTALLDWRAPPDVRYPLILGADITYERRLVPLVVKALATLLEPGGLAILADPNRSSAAGLTDAARHSNLVIESVAAEAVSDSAELGRVRGTIHRLWHRSR